jgi:uncharacterized protein (TIGR02147 family)
MTQRTFIERAGVGSQAYFSDILARRKKLALQHINGFINALELSGSAGEYFTLLVQKEHAKIGEDKERVLKKLARLREKNIASLVTDANAEYFSSWKYPVIREYIVSRGYVESLRTIKRAFLHFAMPLAEVRRTVEKLIQWNLVEKDDKRGGFIPVEGVSTISYSGMPHAVVNDVKRLFIESSVHAMETLPRDERHITMAVRGMSRTQFERFCRRIDALRTEFLESEEVNEENDYVYGLNVQLFPLMSIDTEKINQNNNGNDFNVHDTAQPSTDKGGSE